MHASMHPAFCSNITHQQDGNAEEAAAIEEEVESTLPDFRGMEEFSAEGLSPEQQEEVWRVGTQRFAQLKGFLEQRLAVEHAKKVSSAAGIDKDEALASHSVSLPAPCLSFFCVLNGD
jgi:hypothetical protein